MAPRARVTDSSFGQADAAVEAYIVEPAVSAPKAGILFLHWLGAYRAIEDTRGRQDAIKPPHCHLNS